LERADVTVVSPIVSTNPVVTLILAQIFISKMENLTKWLFIGVGITVAGVIVVTVGSTLQRPSFPSIGTPAQETGFVA
jgi:drug/metabolite transporter (DMT)-like permease